MAIAEAGTLKYADPGRLRSFSRRHTEYKVISAMTERGKLRLKALNFTVHSPNHALNPSADTLAFFAYICARRVS